MQAEVISIGDELTSGQRLDTNSQWISQRLGELGIRVLYHSTVSDDLLACTAAFRQAVERADLIIATGGLGPTADDLTREVLAAVAGRALIRDEQVLAHIRDLFARRGREMPARNEVQALLPEGSRPIANPHGTAPGIDLEIVRKGRVPTRIFALPGVPAELFEMWEQTVAGEVAALRGAARLIRHHRIKCFGVGESELEQMLPDLIRRGRTPLVGITVSDATITLRITSEGPTPEVCYSVMEETIATIHENLGNLVFGTEDDELADVVARLLASQNQTLATVEWGTRGLIARWLGEVSDFLEHYRGAIVIPNVAALGPLLDISEDDVIRHGPCSASIAERMARQVRDRLNSDYGLAVGAVPNRTSSESEITEDGCFHVGLATPTGVTSRSFTYTGHPAILQSRSAKHALNVLRLALIAVNSEQ